MRVHLAAKSCWHYLCPDVQSPSKTTALDKPARKISLLKTYLILKGKRLPQRSKQKQKPILHLHSASTEKFQVIFHAKAIDFWHKDKTKMLTNRSRKIYEKIFPFFSALCSRGGRASWLAPTAACQRDDVKGWRRQDTAWEDAVHLARGDSKPAGNRALPKVLTDFILRLAKYKSESIKMVCHAALTSPSCFGLFKKANAEERHRSMWERCFVTVF